MRIDLRRFDFRCPLPDSRDSRPGRSQKASVLNQAVSRFRSMFRLACLFALIAAPTLAAVPATAGPRVYLKAGVTAAQAATDEAACKDLAKDLRAGKVSAAAPYGASPMAGAIGASIGAGIIQILEDSGARKRGAETCMRRRGYGQVELDRDEAAAFGALKTADQRGAWIAALAATNISERVETARTSAAPPLPSAREEAFVIHGVRIDPAKLTLAAQAVGAKGVVVSGIGSHRRTAVVKSQLVAGPVGLGLMNMAAGAIEPGTIFHQIHLGPHDSNEAVEDMTAWCGPWRRTFGVVHEKGVCFMSTFKGYRTLPLKGETWLGEPDFAYDTRVFAVQPLELVEQSEDGLGTFDFALRLVKMSSKSVTLAGVAEKDGKEVEFWRDERAFDADGRATLPFWTKTLSLRRQDRTVVVAFEPRDDGLGWFGIDR